MRSLGEVLSIAVEALPRPWKIDELLGVVSKELEGLLNLHGQPLADITALLSTAFLGMPRNMDPKALVRGLPAEAFDKVWKEAEARGDGSDGPILFFNVELGRRRGMHQEKDWEWQRFTRFTGEVRVWVKGQRNPLVTAGLSLGDPTDDQIVEDLVEMAPCEVPVGAIPNECGGWELKQMLKSAGVTSMVEKVKGPNGYFDVLVLRK